MSSKSSSAQATNQTDNRRVIGEGGVSAEGSTVNSGGGLLATTGAQITVLDNGAINKAFDFSSQVAKGALDFGIQSQGATAKVLADAYKDAKGRGALTDYILIGAIAMAGLVAFSAVKK